MRRLPPVAGLLWAVVSIALAAVLYTGFRAAPGFDPFVLRSVRVVGAERTLPAKVIAAVGVHTGGGLFSADVAAVRSAVTDLPWVRDARVVRQLPGTLRIEVTEWQPAFLVRLDQLRYLTVEGHLVMAALDQGLDYPVITGLDRATLEGGGRGRDALRNWIEVDGRGLLDEEISELHLDPAAGLTVYTAVAGGAGIHLGWAGYEEKLRRLGRLQDHLRRRGQSAYAVNLTHADRIIARLSPANAGKRRP